MHLSLPAFIPGFTRRHTSPNTTDTNTAPPIRPREDSDPLSTYSREEDEPSSSTNPASGSDGLVSSHPATPTRRLSTSPPPPAQNQTSSSLLRRISSWTPGPSHPSSNQQDQTATGSHESSVPFPCVQAPQSPSAEGADAGDIPRSDVAEQRTRSISATSASSATAVGSSEPRHKPEDFYAKCTGRTREKRSGSFLDAFSMILK